MKSKLLKGTMIIVALMFLSLICNQAVATPPQTHYYDYTAYVVTPTGCKVGLRHTLDMDWVWYEFEGTQTPPYLHWIDC